MVRLPGRPRTRRATALTIGAAVVAAAVVAFLLIYFVFFPTSSPKPFQLSTTGTVSASRPSSLSGEWSVAAGSRAGYRVREQLAFLPAESDAVGRTSQVTGKATLADAHGAVTITDATFTVEVDTLKSDRSMRDEKIHEIGLESDRYPTADFTLTKPIPIPAGSLSGHVERVPATGLLRIHGQTKRVTVPLELTLSGSTLSAVGSLTFPWSEFGMTAPSIGGFVTVTDRATMEFDLRLAQGAGVS
jgi:polyisoprenoid-binding protein YceI